MTTNPTMEDIVPSTTTRFDLAALVAAIEADDPAVQASAYGEDAVVESHNRDHGPADPLIIRGGAAIRALFDDVSSRGLTHRVARAVADDGVGALQVRCSYPDGTQVLCTNAFDVENGLIVRETRVEVWDG